MSASTPAGDRGHPRPAETESRQARQIRHPVPLAMRRMNTIAALFTALLLKGRFHLGADLIGRCTDRRACVDDRLAGPGDQCSGL